MMSRVNSVCSLIVALVNYGKMMKVAEIVTFLLFILAGQGFAAEPAEINLRDGSVIRAEVISLQDGLYTLKSETLGTIVIEKSRISSIKMGTGDPARTNVSTPSSITPNVDPQTGVPNTTAQINTMRDAMMGDQSIMNNLSSLTNDPDVMRAAQDPEIMKDVASGDVTALMSNDKFMQLLNNPAIQEIIKKVSP